MQQGFKIALEFLYCRIPEYKEIIRIKTFGKLLFLAELGSLPQAAK